MQSAAEQFAIQLGRSSKRAARHLHGLSPEDRDDVLAEAMLYCWEHKDAFDPTKRSVDDWFAETVRDVRAAQRKARRGDSERRTSLDRLREFAAREDTAAIAESEKAFEEVMEEFSEDERSIAIDIANGYTLREIRNRHAGRAADARRVYRTLHKYRERIPERRIVGAAAAHISRESDHPRDAAPIDHEIEKMLRRPKTERADCPVCWRCMWFEGLTPKNWKPPSNADAEVKLAVERIEREKIRIAGGDSGEQ